MRHDAGIKKVRRKEWTTTRAPDRFYMYAARNDCANRNSKGFYYFHHSNTRWWFEYKDDAEWFEDTVLYEIDKLVLWRKLRLT